MELYKLTAHELHDKLVNKEVSSVELTNALYERIDAVEDKVNAYVTLDKENALAQAAKVDAKNRCRRRNCSAGRRSWCN